MCWLYRRIFLHVVSRKINMWDSPMLIRSSCHGGVRESGGTDPHIPTLVLASGERSASRIWVCGLCSCSPVPTGQTAVKAPQLGSIFGQQTNCTGVLARHQVRLHHRPSPNLVANLTELSPSKLVSSSSSSYHPLYAGYSHLYTWNKPFLGYTTSQLFRAYC
jgi:hypothetical protein